MNLTAKQERAIRGVREEYVDGEISLRTFEEKVERILSGRIYPADYPDPREEGVSVNESADDIVDEILNDEGDSCGEDRPTFEGQTIYL